MGKITVAKFFVFLLVALGIPVSAQFTPAGTSSSSGGCAGTIGTPCVVESNKTNNNAAPGATNLGVLPCIANAAAPSWTEGFSTNCSVDLAGNQRVTGTISGLKSNNAVAPGSTNLGVLPSLANAASPTWTEGDQVASSVDLKGNQRVTAFPFNGSTTEQAFVCPSQALFNLSGSGDTQIIAASGSTTIRICHISFSTTAPEDIKITRGTGSNCGTGTADVTGLYKGSQSLALDFQPTAALRGAASGAICLNQSASQALGGIVIYAQF